MTGPTHNRTLDLFTLGLSINSLTSEEVFVSDHLCVKFEVSLPYFIDTVLHMRSSLGSLDILPTSLLKEVMNTNN